MSNKNKKQPVKNIYYSNLYSIQKAKSNCEEMALDFLRKTVYFDHPSFCPSVLAFDLSIDDKKRIQCYIMKICKFLWHCIIQKMNQSKLPCGML